MSSIPAVVHRGAPGGPEELPPRTPSPSAEPLYNNRGRMLVPLYTDKGIRISSSRTNDTPHLYSTPFNFCLNMSVCIHLRQVAAICEKVDAAVRNGTPFERVRSEVCRAVMPAQVVAPFYDPESGVRYYYDSVGDRNPSCCNTDHYDKFHRDPTWEPFDDGGDYQTWLTANTKAIERREQAQRQGQA